MPVKRALVVDDSKSARVVLSRMLEKYGIEVDSADSAESALDYLREHHPDVIFMDHLMPGMDGLQAVREIKANPALSAIPIMMYTSQEGEIYSGQARASGAIGVLPKSIRPIDVTKALYQLQLLPERRDAEPSGLLAANGEPGVAVGVSASSTADPRIPADPRLRGQVETLLKEQSVELRRFMVATLEAHTHRIISALRAGEPEEPAVAAPAAPPARPWGWILGMGSALVALAIVAVLYWQATQATQQAQRALEAVTASNQSLTEAIDRWRTASERLAAQDVGPAGPRPIVISVPFGEQALAPSRLEAIRSLVGQLERGGINGTVRIEIFAGSFCLVGSVEGYSLAPPATPAVQCEQFDNPIGDSQAGARQPLTFANFAASVRQRTGGAIELVLVQGPRDRLAATYPPVEQATAGQWNAAAQSNNRIEIGVVEK
ncbi:MAG: response regulator [Gammaproteobacteria bacterium]